MSLLRNIAHSYKKINCGRIRSIRRIERFYERDVSGGLSVAIKNLQKSLRINPQKIVKIVLKIFSLEQMNKPGEITLCFVNDSAIRKLNLKYCGKNNPTDVITFDLAEDKQALLADIVISTDTALRNARIFKTTPLYEIYLYVIHGILHLLGYDDKTIKQRKIMQKRTGQILTAIPIRSERTKRA